MKQTDPTALSHANAQSECSSSPAPSSEVAMKKRVSKAKFDRGPSVCASAVMVEYARRGSTPDMAETVVALMEDIGDVWAGNMQKPEAMLFAQAQALQTIFMNLAMKAQRQGMLKQWEAYLRMGLKAQNQCRMTLETLAALKNPPVVFARQANINNGGQQQVNNGGAAPPPTSHAANPQPGANELLEVKHEQWLDTGAPGAAGGTDPHLETVAAVNRAADRRRKGSHVA